MSGLILKLHAGDERVLLYLLDRRRSWLDSGMRALTHAGDAAVTIGLVVALLLATSPAAQAAGRLAAFALVVSHLAVQLLKRTISRPRPRLPAGIESLAAAPDRFSFPSGHSAAALSVALGVSVAAPGLLVPWLVAVGLLVGVTRCYLGVHYPGDVVAGWLLAVAAFAAGVHVT
jgi:undecaprenyl-diphosphatase